MIIDLIFVFIFSFFSLFALRKIAREVGLIDKQNERKLHKGSIPLVGGLAICITIVQFVYSRPELIDNSNLFLSIISILTIIGALDDKYDVSFKIRIAIQIIISIAMMHFSGIKLLALGNMFGLGEIYLGWIGYLITIIAVIGAINAFNMVDGIDGLLGGLSIVTFSGIAYLLSKDSQQGLMLLCFVFIAALLPYIMMNLGLLGRRRKIFMGDAGSMMIGFSVIWILLSASQREPNTLMRPVTALWLIALPLMDMAAIMFRRIKRGDSPFRPDREHLHHLFQKLGFSSIQTLFAICGGAALLAAFGIIGELTLISESIMFYAFILVFIAYAATLSYVSKRLSNQ